VSRSLPQGLIYIKQSDKMDTLTVFLFEGSQ